MSIPYVEKKAGKETELAEFEVEGLEIGEEVQE